MMGVWSRRELLRTFLAAPAGASVGCGELDRLAADEPPLPPGDLVGSDTRVGHHLRDLHRRGEVPAASGEPTRAPVLILGGGVAGLAAAWRLERLGFRDYLLLELENEVGGTSRGGENAVSRFPWGAHYVPAPTAENPELVRLFDELGFLEGTDPIGEPVVAEEFLCRDPEERIFFRGRWYEGLYLKAGSSAEDDREWDRFQREVDRLVAWRDGKGRRAFTLPVAACSDDDTMMSLDRMTMADWLARNRFTSDRLRWQVDYACRDDYGLTANDASAWAGLFYFASRVTRPGRDPQSLVTWPDGNARLVRHFRDVIGDRRIRTGLAVVDVRPEPGPEGGTTGGRRVRVTACDASTLEPLGFAADRVIVALPRFLARWLVEPLRAGLVANRAGSRGATTVNDWPTGAWAVANLTLKRRPAEHTFPLAWDNVLYESPSLGYVAATHQSGHDYGPTVFTWYYPLTESDPEKGRARLLSLGRDDWARLALADLRRAHPDLPRLVERIDVCRFGHAMIQPRPGVISGAARRQAATPIGPIHFAGTDLSGMALFEEAFHHGLRAADEVLAARPG